MEMAGLSRYLLSPPPLSPPGVLPPRNWPRIMAKKMIHAGGDEPRTGLKLQGSRGLSPYGQVSQSAGQRIWNTHTGPGGRDQLLLWAFQG